MYRYGTIRAISDYHVILDEAPNVTIPISVKVRGYLAYYKQGQKIKYALDDDGKMIVIYDASGSVSQSSNNSAPVPVGGNARLELFVSVLPSAVKLVVASGVHEHDIENMAREVMVYATMFCEAADRYGKGIPVVSQ